MAPPSPGGAAFTMTTIDLNQESIPVDSPLLPLIQGNILRGFSRDHSRWVFFRLGTDPAAARSTLARLAGYVTTAQQQEEWRQETKVPASESDPCRRYQASRTNRLYGNLFLSPAGYQAIGSGALARELSRRELEAAPSLSLEERTLFDGGLFEPGMASPKSAVPLKDKLDAWNPDHFDPAQPWCALLLLTSDALEALMAALDEVLTIVGERRHVEVGRVLRDEQCRAHEHFGYQDGRSQPLFFKDALEKDPPGLQWNPAAKLKQALIADPGAGAEGGFGSFLVFRKLQQDVTKFDAMVEQLAKAIDPVAADVDRAGALLIGRFKDGTPLVLSDKPQFLPVPANDFDHITDDPRFLRCPAFAHTRRANPRLDQPLMRTKFLQTRIARRGMPYGEPGDEDVGLLFAAFMSSIVGQFVTIQRSWANEPHFMPRQPGIDPLIGQGAGPVDQEFPKHWDGVPDAGREPFRLAQAITLLGGDYFFAPSISFLKSLG